MKTSSTSSQTAINQEWVARKWTNEVDWKEDFAVVHENDWDECNANIHFEHTIRQSDPDELVS